MTQDESKKSLGQTTKRFLLSSAGISIGLFVLSLVLYFSYYDQGLIFNDEGHLVHFAERMYSGETPGVDFHLETYIFGRYALLGFLFWLLGGPHLLIERGMWVVLRALCVVMEFYLARRIMPRGYALCSALLLMVVPGPWHKTPYAFCTLLGLTALFAYLSVRTRIRLALCAVATGVCLLLRQDVGLVVMGVTALILVFPVYQNKYIYKGPGSRTSWPAQVVTRWVVYLLVLFVTLIPAVGYLYISGAFQPVFTQCFIEKFEQHLGLFNFFFRWGKMWEAGDWVGCSYFLIPPIVFILSILCLLRLFIRRREEAGFLELFALLLLAALTINQAYNHALVIRLLQCGAPLYILIGYLFWRLAVRSGPLINKNKQRAWETLGMPAVLGVLMLIFAVEIITSNREMNLGIEYRGTFATYSPDNIAIKSPRAGVEAYPAKAKMVNKILACLKREVAPDDSIYVATNDSIFYFLSGRPNPSRFGKFFMPGELEGRAELVADEIRKNPPDYIITTDRLVKEKKGHPAVKFISKNYLGFKSFDTQYMKRYLVLKKM